MGYTRIMTFFRKRSRGAASGDVARSVPVNDLSTLSGAFVLDVREPDEFADGTIPGAVNVPLGDLPRRLPMVPRDRTIACLCRSGNRSEKARALLVDNGYDAVNLTGGMIAWKSGR